MKTNSIVIKFTRFFFFTENMNCSNEYRVKERGRLVSSFTLTRDSSLSPAEIAL